MNIAEFHEPIAVENLLDRLVVPLRSSTPAAQATAWKEPVFPDVLRVLFKLGAIHGDFDPDIWRATMLSILEDHFGAPVQQIEIAGEISDVIICPEGHVLCEIAGNAGPKTTERILRKRKNYTEITGVAPARVILLTADIRSKWANLLEAEGVEIPLIDDDYSFEPCN